MDAYCSSVLYLCCLQLDPSRTSLCRMSTTSAKENSRTFLSFDLWKGSISLFVFFTKKTTTYFSTFCFWISFHSISIHSHSDQHWRTCFQLGTCNMSPFAVDRKTYTRFVVVFFQSFSRSFYSSLILLSLLTFFITHCISCVGGSLIFHGMETSSPERQRSSPIDKCQDSLHSFTLPVQTFTARIRLATSTESNHSHSIHVKHERFTQTTFFPATSTLWNWLPFIMSQLLSILRILIFLQPTLLLQSGILFIITVLTAISTLSDSRVLHWVTFSKKNICDTIT